MTPAPDQPGGIGTLGSEDPTDEPDDRELMSRHVAGDPDAFSELFRRHKDRLWAVAMRTLSDPEEASDALQDAMISAYRRAQQYRGDSLVTTWLHRVVVNACLDRLRRRKVRQAESLPEEEDRVAEMATETPDDPAETRELRLDVMSALKSLGEEQRAAIVLVDMEGYSVEEAAAMLDCAPGTVKSRCARGRAKLVPLLTHLHGAGESSDPAASAAAADHRDRGKSSADRGNHTPPAGVSGPSDQHQRSSREQS